MRGIVLLCVADAERLSLYLGEPQDRLCAYRCYAAFLIDAALTAARADEREKCAQIVDQWETAQDAIVTDLNRKLQCTSPHDYAAQCLEGCAAAIRAMEGR